ncbi:hypothetical protein BGZ93_011315 [Podila epicladia]|nr:hypothetical protein BGZ93_011315 [Podila epicladia]
MKLGNKDELVLYVDGLPAAEKPTPTINASKTVLRLANARSESSSHWRTASRPTSTFANTTSTLPTKNSVQPSAGPWDSRDFVDYMANNDYEIILCATEADIKIAADCKEVDVVITGDSDLLYYKIVPAVLRPIGRGKSRRYWLYDKAAVLDTLDLTAMQLTALAVISGNDYNRNVPYLGIETNRKIIRGLAAVEDETTIVEKYLADPQVVFKIDKDESKNWTISSYADSLKVFVNMQQDIAPQPLTTPADLDTDTIPSYLALRSRMDQFKARFAEHTKAAYEARVAKRAQNAAQSLPPAEKKPRNIFATIDKPGPVRPDKYHPRYTPKVRYDPIKEQAPPLISYQHFTLDLGPLTKNVRAVLKDSPAAESVINCIRGAVHEASTVKRRCQELIGLFLNEVFFPAPAPGVPRPKEPAATISSQDQSFLDDLCPCLLSKEMAADAENENGAEDGHGECNKTTFLQCFLIYLYSGNLPQNKGKGVAINTFICRLQDLGILPKSEMTKAETLKNIKEYTPSHVVRAVASQLTAELKRHYKHGCKQLSEKNGFMTFTEIELGAFFHKRDDLHPELESLIGFKDNDRSLTQADVICDWLPFESPGKLIKHLVAPVDPDPDPITGPLCGRKKTEAGIATVVKIPTRADIRTHINTLCTEGFDPRSYTQKGYILCGSIKTDGYSMQLLTFKVCELLSVQYKRYPSEVLPDRLLTTTSGTGDFLTEVHNVFQTKEDVERLLGCTSDQADTISYLEIDLGQACVASAYAILPSYKEPRIGGHRRHRGHKKRGSRGRKNRGSRCGRVTKDTRARGKRHINLAAKQKAVALPTLKHRAWMEVQKNAVLVEPTGQDGIQATTQAQEGVQQLTNNTEETPAKAEPKSIIEIESALPPLRGNRASFTDHMKHRNANKDVLDMFYNDRKFKFKRHKWLARRAREEEYHRLADGLLRMVGGSIGTKKKGEDKVIIGIGLGRFASTSRLSSLHGTFEAFFVNKARALGYLVVGVNEYYTSKKCPKCGQFVAQTKNLRRLYCRHCKKYMHRDVMAGHNICNILQGHIKQERPDYLQPVDQYGNYPWKESRSKHKVQPKSASGPSQQASSGGGEDGHGVCKRRASEGDDENDSKKCGKRPKAVVGKRKTTMNKGKPSTAMHVDS